MTLEANATSVEIAHDTMIQTLDRNANGPQATTRAKEGLMSRDEDTTIVTARTTTPEVLAVTPAASKVRDPDNLPDRTTIVAVITAGEDKSPVSYLRE